jgi:hypothetical protein
VLDGFTFGSYEDVKAAVYAVVVGATQGVLYRGINCLVSAREIE